MEITNAFLDHVFEKSKSLFDRMRNEPRDPEVVGGFSEDVIEFENQWFTIKVDGFWEKTCHYSYEVRDIEENNILQSPLVFGPFFNQKNIEKKEAPNG